MQLVDIIPGSASSNPEALTNIGGTLFFGADDGVTGRELWTSNGTAAGTVQLADLRAATGDSFFLSSHKFTNVGGTLFFVLDVLGNF